MFNRKNLFETGPGEILGYLSTLNDIGSSLNNNEHIEATLFMVAKALLCKIKLLFEKKNNGWKMTCQSAAPSNNTAAGPATLYAQAENGAPFYPRDRGRRSAWTSGHILW